MAEPFIDARGLSKSFATPKGVRHVLRDVSLTVDRGEFVSIVGGMGTGKSTLLALIAGLTNPDEGRVFIAGEAQDGVRGDSGFVFQNYSLLPWLTALENVRLAIEASFPQLSRSDQRARAHGALERVGLAAAADRRPRQLSGGMRQRVAIARAMATEPKLVLLDDPFGALDALTRETLQQQLVDLSSAGSEPVTVVMVTNSVDEAILLSDRIIPVIPGPPATLGPAVDVVLSRPRTVNQLTHDDEAIHVRGQIVSALTEALRASRARAGRTVQTSGPVTSAVGMMPAAIAAEEPR
jgi:nitrate/nitrite transport system ATP-binding protein